ncbi:hypothetical protein LZQ00_15375 [Sphingobacterium sp. SRCM116780]|uniref:hypothetical protein n=1 Tax=Sphingobacterium sp. SRCM116780 TaxID=2907623 RepID=UPI001F2F4E32|nr:hypothetical protein [Sphingobacterium sp. SRCM116780]UIR55638.1 hypothetical protein LZQ00_15375 [Sphingobacterium sp. SRCM116780]
MKNLKNNFAKILIIMSVFFVFSSCKKDNDNNQSDTKSGSFTYQGKTMDIKTADYRGGDGDGAWLYFMTGDYHALQIRFSGLGDYVIPIGTFTFKNGSGYNPTTNFKGGAVTINNVGDEINGGTVVIEKEGDKYKIRINTTTEKGPLSGNFEGTLEKI